MKPVDDLVYLVPGGKDYAANFEEHGWQRWPACNNGWAERQRCREPDEEERVELPPRLAQLALRLSGVQP